MAFSDVKCHDTCLDLMVVEGRSVQIFAFGERDAKWYLHRVLATI